MDQEPDAAAGSESTLHALYDLVPGAEEVDLAEEARREREQAEALVEVLAEVLAAPDDDAEPTSDDEPTDAVDPLTDGQVQGMLEHLLGAEVLDDEVGRGHET